MLKCIFNSQSRKLFFQGLPSPLEEREATSFVPSPWLCRCCRYLRAHATQLIATGHNRSVPTLYLPRLCPVPCVRRTGNCNHRPKEGEHRWHLRVLVLAVLFLDSLSFSFCPPKFDGFKKKKLLFLSDCPTT